MQIILTKSVTKLGKVGDIVKVRDGYGRNFLLPNNLAIRATKDNLNHFDSIKAELEKKNQDTIATANKVAKSINGKNITFIEQSSADGKLYGSISARDIALKLSEIADFELSYEHIALDAPVKFNGVYEVKINLHPEVSSNIVIVVAKSEEEAKLALQQHNEPEEKKEAEVEL